MARPKREVPWIAKRGGVYYAFWHREGEAETQRLSLRTRDSSEAKNRFAQFLSEGSLAEPRGNAGITVRQILDDYYREHASKKCADPRRQEDAIVHLKAFFGDTPLDRVGIPQSRAYADARRAGVIGGGQRHFDERRKGSDSTIRRELVVLHAASKHAQKWKRTTAVLHLDLPAEKRLGEDEQAPYYTREEFTRLVGKADGELRQFITLAYYTGARRRSIAAFNQTSSVVKRGLALTPVKFGISFNATIYNQAGALLHIYTDGTVLVNHGGTEMGQGLFTKVAQVVAEELGLPISSVRLVENMPNPEDSIYRSKAVGEPPLMLAISVLAAIRDAVCSVGGVASQSGRQSVVLPQLTAPATPEAVLRAVNAMREATLEAKSGQRGRA